MRDKKLQVFVSSTFEDLKEGRQAAVEAILSAGHIPAGMKLFTAGDETQMTVIKRWMDNFDVYLLILGGRYGSVDKTQGKSYTQLEYEYAVEKGKALFAVVISDNGLDVKVAKSGRGVIEQKYQNELSLFREEILTKLVKFWDDKNHIENAIYKTLNEFSYREELIGWVRGDNTVTGVVAEELARLGKENEELKGKIFENNSSVFYSTLSYTQLENLLKNNICDLYDNKISLFNFLMEYGHNWNKSFHISDFITSIFGKEQINDYEESIDNILDSLSNLRVLKQIDGGWYDFTNDGHNFYLKTLALQNEEFNSHNFTL